MKSEKLKSATTAHYHAPVVTRITGRTSTQHTRTRWPHYAASMSLWAEAKR